MYIYNIISCITHIYEVYRNVLLAARARHDAKVLLCVVLLQLAAQIENNELLG